MGECEAAHLASVGVTLAIDEPYQHFQFAGRADVLAWNLDERRLLHIENKSRIDDIQELAGAYNAKRVYLAAALGDRLGVGPRMAHGEPCPRRALVERGPPLAPDPGGDVPGDLPRLG